MADNKRPELDPTTGEPKKRPKLDPKTGEPYNMLDDPFIQKVRAGVQGVFPILRPIADIAATTTGDPTLQALNPYAGKEPLAKGLAYVADILGQGVQAAAMTAPGLSPALRGAQVALQAGMGVGSEMAIDELMKNPEAKKFLEGEYGKILGDYALPVLSIALTGLGTKGALNRAKPKTEINAFLQKNPDATKDMFNTLNKVTNTEEGMAKLGFDSSKGNYRKVGDELVTEIQKNIKKEMNDFGFMYNRIKNVPVDKTRVKQIIDKMDAEMKLLGNSREDMAVKRDITKYKDILKSQKKSTLESVDNVKKDFYKDLKNVSKEFESSNADRIAGEIGRFMIDNIEDTVPAADRQLFQAVKKSYGSMAEARGELNNLSKISSEKIMQRITDGDKIESLDRLASPNVVSKAIKITSRAKNPNNYTKTMDDYFKTLQKIDQLNEDFAKKLFNFKELPAYARMTGKDANLILGGSGTATAGEEIAVERFQGLTPEERKRIIVKNSPKNTLKSLEERRGKK